MPKGNLNSKIDGGDWIRLDEDGTGYIEYRIKSGWAYIRVSAGNSSKYTTTANNFKKLVDLPEEIWPKVYDVGFPGFWNSRETATIFLSARADKHDLAVWSSRSGNYYTGTLVYPL